MRIKTVLLSCLLGAGYLSAAQVSVSSPDSAVVMTISDVAGLSYSVSLDNRPVLSDSRLKLVLDGSVELGSDLSIVSSAISGSDTSWEAVESRKKIIRDNYNQAEITLQTAAGKKISLICRAYNEGVAFRYAFGTDFGSKVTIADEKNEFAFTGDFVCWPAFLNSFTTEHQALYPQSLLSDISAGDLVGPPLTVKLADDLYCSVTEAALVNWAGLYLTRDSKDNSLYKSPAFIGGGEPVRFNVGLPAGTRQLRLVVDAVDGNGFDHVDLVDLELIKSDGSKISLSDLKPSYARQSWGSLRTNKSVDGNKLKVGSKPYDKGLGTHSDAAIGYDIPADIVALTGIAGIDDEVGSKGKARLEILAVESPANNTLISTLSRLDQAANAVVVNTPAVSPWRVIMLGRRPVDLVNSDIIVNLNPPSQIADTSWIKAGMCSWNWLSCGNGMDMNLLKGFIDLSAALNWDYCLIDDGWYKGMDCLTPIDGLDIPELVEYARGKGVKIWVWVHWRALEDNLQAAMALYNQWGIVGIKTDFMSRDDQWMVNWYEKILQVAASHKIMINFHGCYKPTGTARTWPNFMTCEAIYGNEQNLGTSYNNPVHKTTLPFTRMLAGIMDHTPGAFLNANKDKWHAQRPVISLGTRAQELAICLVYDSGLISTADKPSNYYGQPGLDFLKGLPASWDDSIALDGQIGQYYIAARRKGHNWYLGALTDFTARNIDLKLDFLEQNAVYNATIYEDGANVAQDAASLNIKTISVTANDILVLKMASGGGVAVIFNKQ